MSVFVLLSACIAPGPGTAPATGSGHTGGPPDTLWVWDGNWKGRVGATVALIDATGQGDFALVVAAPSTSHWEDPQAGAVHVLQLPAQSVGDLYTEADTSIIPRPWTHEEDHYTSNLGAGLTAPGDVTGDGLPDLLILDPSEVSGSGAWLLPGRVDDRDIVATDSGALIALEGWAFDPRIAPCGDLTGDGLADLCVPDGVYIAPVTGGPPDVTWSAPVEPAALAGVDLDGDAVRELVLVDEVAGTLRHGVLADVVPEDGWAGLDVRSVRALPDLDGDGDEELAVVLKQEGGLQVFGAPTPSAPWLTAGTPVEDVTVGDFDGDGVPDLAVGGGDAVAIHLGPLSPGALGTPSAVLQGAGEDGFGASVSALDVDGDGRAELAVGAPRAADRYGDMYGSVYLFYGGGL